MPFYYYFIFVLNRLRPAVEVFTEVFTREYFEIYLLFRKRASEDGEVWVDHAVQCAIKQYDMRGGRRKNWHHSIF